MSANFNFWIEICIVPCEYIWSLCFWMYNCWKIALQVQFYSKSACVKPVLTALLVLLHLGSVPAPAGAGGQKSPHARRAGLSCDSLFTWLRSLAHWDVAQVWWRISFALWQCSIYSPAVNALPLTVCIGFWGWERLSSSHFKTEHSLSLAAFPL